MVEKVAERRGKERGQQKVQIRKVAGEPARDEEEAPSKSIEFRSRLFWQTAMYELSGCQSGHGVTDVIHRLILHKIAMRTKRVGTKATIMIRETSTAGLTPGCP